MLNCIRAKGYNPRATSTPLFRLSEFGPNRLNVRPNRYDGISDFRR